VKIRFVGAHSARPSVDLQTINCSSLSLLLPFARLSTNDRAHISQALVLSNMGRLMRICAQSIADSENEEFTPYEQNLYDNAIEYYQKVSCKI